MVELTEAVRAEPRRWLDSDTPTHEVTVRLTYSDASGWKLSRDARAPGDVTLMTDDDVATLVCSQELARCLEGAILHYRGLGDDRYGGAGVVLLRPRVGAVRPDWSPRPTQQSRRHAISWRTLNSVFRRQVATGSTTQNASP